MGFENTIVACWYRFNQSFLLQAEICYRANIKYLDIIGFEEFKMTPISEVAKLLLRSGNKIIINPHEPLKAELDAGFRVHEINLDLENIDQYEDLLSSLNCENKIVNTCNITYEKPYKKQSLFLLLQGCVDELKPTFLDALLTRSNRKTINAINELLIESVFDF